MRELRREQAERQNAKPDDAAAAPASQASATAPVMTAAEASTMPI